MGLFAKKTLKTLTVEGMRCPHCSARVENALGELSGVSAKVDLATKTVTVAMKKEHTDDELKKAVEELGFTVTEIK
ncbi:MAG: heavy-metal-associated domain-containing protein [Clostridia bacterium]|jgi:copper chaperone CopZ|nr:heavy-metal-associated domain-containing protein [Clostridia bacterium]MBQ2252064.1 heavy-metal-associated domain-containing protein [Clostridia bacterium]